MADANIILKVLDVLIEHPEKVGGSGAISLAAALMGLKNTCNQSLRKCTLKLRKNKKRTLKSLRSTGEHLRNSKVWWIAILKPLK